MTGNEIADSIRAVRENIARACEKAGRSVSDVRLIAVTKTVDLARIREAASSGILDFGENYIQEARQKIELFRDGACWHMIGHVQRNKIKYIPSLFDYVHSIDRWELVEALESYGKEMKVLFEMNLSGEASKQGAGLDDLKRILDRLCGLRFVRPVGLMTMAPYVEDPETVRPVFAGLRKNLEELNREFPFAMKELSMGMSSDYRIAIEEGATMIRIGTAIFGERVYAQ